MAWYLLIHKHTLKDSTNVPITQNSITEQFITEQFITEQFITEQFITDIIVLNGVCNKVFKNDKKVIIDICQRRLA